MSYWRKRFHESKPRWPCLQALLASSKNMSQTVKINETSSYLSSWCRHGHLWCRHDLVISTAKKDIFPNGQNQFFHVIEPVDCTKWYVKIAIFPYGAMHPHAKIGCKNWIFARGCLRGPHVKYKKSRKKFSKKNPSPSLPLPPTPSRALAIAGAWSATAPPAPNLPVCVGGGAAAGSGRPRHLPWRRL